jgi:hypothetical protein
MLTRMVLGTVILCGFVFSMQQNCFAQEKTTVGIMALSYAPEAVSSQYVNSIQEKLTDAFVKTKRFNVVDRSKMDALTNEKELAKTEAFIDSKVIEQGKSLGAAFLVSGHVISAAANQITHQDPTTGQTVSEGFKAKLSISVKVIDVSTGEVIASETIEPKGGSFLGEMTGMLPKTADAAIAKAINDIEKKIDTFVAHNFPVTLSIVEIQEKNSKGEAITVLISGGSALGISKGDKLKVVEISEIEVNGNMMQRKKNIGELRIVKVEDENFSICSVKSGGIDITSKFEAKAKIQVITIE